LAFNGKNGFPAKYFFAQIHNKIIKKQQEKRKTERIQLSIQNHKYKYQLAPAFR